MKSYQIQYKIGIRVVARGGNGDREGYLEQIRRNTSYDMRCGKISHFCHVIEVELLRAYVAFTPVTSYLTGGTVHLVDCDLAVTVHVETNNPNSLTTLLPSSCVFIVAPDEETGIRVDRVLFTGLEHLSTIDITEETHPSFRAPYTERDLAVEIIMPNDIKAVVRGALAAGQKVELVHSRFDDAGEDWTALEVEGKEVWRVNGY